MRTKVKYFYNEDICKNEPLVQSLVLDCDVTEALVITAALHDFKGDKGRNAHDRTCALKMLHNIKEAFDVNG